LRRFFLRGAAPFQVAPILPRFFAAPSDSARPSGGLFPIHPESLSTKNKHRAKILHQNRIQKNRFKNRNKKLFAHAFFIAKKGAVQIII